MSFLHIFLLLVHSLFVVAETVSTGFCYGAFFSDRTPKTYKDFKASFERAQKIEGAGVTFNSARIFTTTQWGTTDTPIEAIKAAMDTNTTLFLGLSPWGKKQNLENDLSALDKAFAKYGSKLGNLIVGLSVGNEEIYRGSNLCEEGCEGGATEAELQEYIKITRNHIAASPYDDVFKNIPIGHVDISPLPIKDSVDFVGATVYPFWGDVPLDAAHENAINTIDEVKGKVGNKPIWIAETGWPYAGHQRGSGEVGPQGMQQYWTEVGCALFGKYNMWWFQLEHDAGDGYDWGLLDKQGKLRIDTTCPGKGKEPESSTSSASSSAATTITSTIVVKTASTTSESPQQSPASPTTLLTVTSTSQPHDTPSSTSTTPSASLPPSSTPCAAVSTAVMTEYECVNISLRKNDQRATVTRLATAAEDCTRDMALPTSSNAP